MWSRRWREADVKWAGMSSFVKQEDREWVLAKKQHGLYLGNSKTGAWMFVLNLDRCDTSAGVLDGIAELSEKRWMTNDDLANLVRTLNEILDLRPSLCGEGKERGPIDVTKILAGSRVGKDSPREPGRMFNAEN